MLNHYHLPTRDIGGRSPADGCIVDMDIVHCHSGHRVTIGKFCRKGLHRRPVAVTVEGAVASHIYIICRMFSKTGNGIWVIAGGHWRATVDITTCRHHHYLPRTNIHRRSPAYGCIGNRYARNRHVGHGIAVRVLGSKALHRRPVAVTAEGTIASHIYIIRGMLIKTCDGIRILGRRNWRASRYGTPRRHHNHFP